MEKPRAKSVAGQPFDRTNPELPLTPTSGDLQNRAAKIRTNLGVDDAGIVHFTAASASMSPPVNTDY
jgi:hypothetical protein